MPCCCTDGDPGAPAVRAPPASPVPEWPTQPTPELRRRRIATAIQWTASLMTLALIPKCPACVAAYVLLFTGVGVTLAAATALRWALIAVSTAAVVCLLLGAARRAFMLPAKHVQVHSCDYLR